MEQSFKNRYAMAFVLITVMINSIGFGIIIPVLPDLVRELKPETPEHELGRYMAGMTFVFAIMQFVFMPIIGALSDKYGRRPIMLLSLFGLSLDYFLLAFAPFIFLLFVARAISGALGATFSTANAYIADISPPETRAQNFALVGAAFGVGFMIGPAIGGILGDPEKFLGSIANPRLPFFAAGVLCLLNFTLGFFVLPETHKLKNRREFKWSRANPIGALNSLRNISNAKGLIFVLFLLAAAHTVYPTTYTISTQVKLGWTSGDVGMSLLAFGIASFIVQAGIIRVVLPRTGLFWGGTIGMIAAIIAYAGMGFANAGWVIYFMGIFAALAGFYNPALTNMMSSRVSESEQGELQGAIGAAQGLALIAGPLIMGPAFEIFAKEGTSYYQPGAPFLAAALLSVLSIMTFFIVTTKEDRTRILPTAASVPPSAELGE
ncbi:MAG: MFS transporter [Acidimicrobiales bacterium]|nr:TCR/Tet family MFS transporter [Hyphomonadaceae bacterium]RZV37783.1 MAG: MFS transporter [Acidimicrobiales bacterium]